MATENFGLPEPTTAPKMPKVSKAKGGVIKVEAMSLDQFRSYLKGIMFVGGPTWRPDREQWEAIVAIIDKLTIDSPQQQQRPAPQQQSYPVQQGTGWDQTQPSWQPLTPQQVRQINAMDGVNEDGGSYATPFV